MVTAITPTKAGIGKTTTSVGLSDGLKKLGKKVVLALREPSLGPCFGMKGGAAGGGYSQVVPMEEINLHFTGDFHAITAANNTLAALLDNYRFYNRGKPEGIKTVLWKRCLDVNDRVLRKIVTALDTPNNGIPSETGFVITPASEIMAVLCLSEGLEELRKKIDVDDLVINQGAGFIVAVCGEMVRMPGLPKIPQANNIDVVGGKIIGVS